MSPSPHSPTANDADGHPPRLVKAQEVIPQATPLAKVATHLTAETLLVLPFTPPPSSPLSTHPGNRRFRPRLGRIIPSPAGSADQIMIRFHHRHPGATGDRQRGCTEVQAHEPAARRPPHPATRGRVGTPVCQIETLSPPRGALAVETKRTAGITPVGRAGVVRAALLGKSCWAQLVRQSWRAVFSSPHAKSNHRTLHHRPHKGLEGPPARLPVARLRWGSGRSCLCRKKKKKTPDPRGLGFGGLHVRLVRG